jgi:hypothetical protein
VFLFATTQSFSQGLPIYDNIPNPLPGNLASLGYEATSTSEFGDRIKFSSNGGRSLISVTVTLSSWGCETGRWEDGDCSTTPGTTFSHPITLKLYNVNADGSVGSPIGGPVTQTFNIPYRPSADSRCSGDNAGKWYDASAAHCYNGLATTITFPLNVNDIPDEVIFGIAYNTTHHGYSPVGESASCFTEPGGCGYDSLNVALANDVRFGENPAAEDAYLNSTWAGAYCGAGTLGAFRLDAGCWAETGKPAVRFNAKNHATTANQCKIGGWRTRTTETGTPFVNQGDCVSYVVQLAQ